MFIIDALDRGEVWPISLFPQADISTIVFPYQRCFILHNFTFHPNHQIMSSDLIDLIDQYYEAKKPYTKSLLNARADPPSQTKSTTESQEPQFSITPPIPSEEMMNVLKKLEAAKIEYAQAEKGSTAEASAEKKGKAPVGKK